MTISVIMNRIALRLNLHKVVYVFRSFVAAKNLGADALRFFIAGAANTLFTTAVYQILLFFLPPSISYLVAWVVGFILVLTVYPEKVFPGGQKDFVSRVLFAIAYFAVFLAGLGLLHWLNAAGLSSRFSIFAALSFTSILNLFFGRLFLR